jgi:aryl-alcohol dehydrogenase-like predicted oxidoreductase
MELRMLGRSGLKVSPLCLGGNVFGWTIDEKRSFEVLNAFVGAGFNFIDTADVYSTWVPGHQGGESEAIIGNWMKSRGNRASVVIATKVGMEMRGQKVTGDHASEDRITVSYDAHATLAAFELLTATLGCYSGG